MDNLTRTMIDSLTQDILDSFHIQVPIQDMDELVQEASRQISVMQMGQS